MPIFNMVGGGGGTGATLVITAPAGVTVTLNNDSETKTSTASSSGVATFKGLETGTWTVTISDGNRTASDIVIITSDYSITMAFFAAKITVTYPQGSTLTCTDGATTLTATDTTGSYIFTIPNTGNWTVSCTDGTSTASSPISITEDGVNVSVELSYKRYLINGTDRCTTVTGGFTCANLPMSEASNKVWPTMSSSGSQTKISAIGGGSSGVYYGWLVRTNNKIDVADYDSLILNGTQSSAGKVYLRLWPSIGSYGNANVAAGTRVSGSQTIVDVSTLMGSYYIGFAGEISGSETVSIMTTDLYLE